MCRTSMFFLLIFLLSATTSLAVEKIYFSDVGNFEIMRCDLDGTNLESLVTSGIVQVGYIAIDRVGGRMYWTEWPSAGSCIKRAELDGSNMETLLTGLGGPSGIALDIPAGKMYWTEFSPDVIRRANLDGTGVEDLVVSGLTHAAGIALDLAAGKMYWTDGSNENLAKIQRANLNGTLVETLVEDPLIAPTRIDLDLDAGKMYLADLGTDSWFRANLDGTDLEEILLSEFGTPSGCALDLTNQQLYVSDYGGLNSEIKRCNLDGTGVQDVVTSGVGATYGLTLGPAEAECGDSWLSGPWLIIVTGVEVYDYAVYMIFDGLGTISDMGSFSVPYPAGTYAVEADCDMTGDIWTDSYTPFTGSIHSDSTAEMDIGPGPMQLIRVSNPAALEECWRGWFLQDTTGMLWNVTMEIDGDGNIVSSTGFPGPLSGRILTENGYLAGHLEIAGPAQPDQIMFQDAAAVGDSVMSGSYDMDCISGCQGGTFQLVLCSSVSAVEDSPAVATLDLSNHPNPFNPATTISFSMPAAGSANLRVYDVSGRLVNVLIDEEVVDQGRNEVVWRGRDMAERVVSAGVYFYRLETGSYSETKRMTLIK